MLTITKEFSFHAAHRLYLQTHTQEQNRAIYGKCSNLHGHSYRLQITVSGPIDQYGMIINFDTLKRLVKELVIDRYEHCYLNELEEFRERVPTVENMVSVIFSRLSKRLQKDRLKLMTVTLFETPTSWSTLQIDA